MHHLYFIKKLGIYFYFAVDFSLSWSKPLQVPSPSGSVILASQLFLSSTHERLFPGIDGFTVLDAWLECATDHFTLLTVSIGRMNWPCQFSLNKILNISCLHYFGCFIFRKIITTYNVLFRAYTR